jgi:hypothetical protein
LNFSPNQTRSHQEQVSALQQQIESLLNQLAEAWQIKVGPASNPPNNEPAPVSRLSAFTIFASFLWSDSSPGPPVVPQATAQREVALHNSARVAAEAEAAELRDLLAKERLQADRQILQLREQLMNAQANGKEVGHWQWQQQLPAAEQGGAAVIQAALGVEAPPARTSKPATTLVSLLDA